MQVLKDQTELVAGRAANDAVRPPAFRQAAADRDDNFVGGVEAVGFVDDGKVVDRRHAIDRGLALGRRHHFQMLGQPLAQAQRFKCPVISS